MIIGINFFSLRVPYIFRLFVFLPILLFINFPFEYNFDYENYYPNYVNGFFAYEPLYEWYSYICREFLYFDFFLFWLSISIIELFFFALIYKTILQIFLAIPSIIGMSQFFYGTQVRYALASLVIVYAVINISKPILKIFTIIVASFIHYGGIIIGIIGLLSGKLNDNLFTINKLKPFLALIFLLLFSFFAFQNFDYLVSLTRFYYYINSGEFVERISLVSLLYIIFSLIILVVLFTLSKENRTQSVKIAILTLLFSLFASPIAALSGRISLFYFVFEPVLLGSLLITTGGRFFKFALFILYLVRVIFYIYINEFYFYS